ncbi:hypothetical protein cypCar_00021775 [Cyprinus carpio]|nr:hypothetical protein cypCar_00021775 [Cyprinus carpio]
MFVTFGVCL